MTEPLLLPFGIDYLAALGMLSGVLSLFCFAPYIVDTLHGRTQPERASWLIWSMLGVIAVFSQSHEGAASSLIFAMVQVGGTIVIFTLSIRLGAGRYNSRKTMVIYALTALGLVAWYISDSAAYALAITISISMLGGFVTIQKSYRNPSSETMSTWVMGGVASVCAVFSVGKLDWVLLAYPLYLLVLYSCIILALVLGRWAARSQNSVAAAAVDSIAPPVPDEGVVAMTPSPADLLPTRPVKPRGKLWIAQSLPIAEATSAMRHEKPHSLSYQASTRTVRPPTTLV